MKIKTKIYTFYGPRAQFDNQIKRKQNKEFFTQIVQEYDEEIKSIHHKIDNVQEIQTPQHKKRKIKNLIVYSDEYATITEGAIQNFTSILDFFDINNVYLQNPPYLIYNKLKKIYNFTEENYIYNKIDIDEIKKINKEFSNNIIGQERAKKDLLKHLLSFEKFKNDDKPIVLMFYGPSGVGKTETAKFLGKVLDEKIFYKQLSMFQNNDFATYLFGGLVSQNSFAKELLDRESNVILLDEFDKANTYFYSAFYQLFDEGTYNDKNYSVKLNNGIIICTSNFDSEEEIRQKLGDPIYYRFDGFIRFNALSNEDLISLIDIYYDKYISELNENDKKIIKEFKNINGENLREILHNSSSKFINARKVNSIVKECILELLLKNSLNQ